jgi:hypothetical protein
VLAIGTGLALSTGMNDNLLTLKGTTMTTSSPSSPRSAFRNAYDVPSLRGRLANMLQAAWGSDEDCRRMLAATPVPALIRMALRIDGTGTRTLTRAEVRKALQM